MIRIAFDQISFRPRFGCNPFWYFACLAFAIQAIASHSRGAELTSKVADGELHACQAVTVDHSWAVGDRGLILATNDAGKTWTVQHQRNNATFYATCFENERVGWVFGGSIEPYSHRSVGSILVTQDGGLNWQTIPCNLPRIKGVQWLKPNHLLAWGDWSSLYQSALFESVDGGQSWSARPTPTSHVQCATAGANGTIVLVDRTSRIYRTVDGLEYEQIGIPQSPFDPIRFCKWLNGVWWLGGDAGTLYRSNDSIQWQRIELPGTPQDRAMYALNDLASSGGTVWIVGQPGNVVWTSEDSGDSWSVRPLGNALPTNAISALNKNVLLTCGPMATIHSSRNAGKAWWAQHRSGGRSVMTQFASTSSGVAWDLLAHVVQESRRNASVLVLHDQNFEERLSHLPELASRFETSGKSIGLSQSRVLPNMPVGNLLSGVRSTDLGYYAPPPSRENQTELSSLVKRLILEIRSQRPDVVVSPCPSTGNALETNTANAIEQAVRLAGQKDFRIFSHASGIDETAWQAQRILARGHKNGLQYNPSMILKTQSTVLGSVLAPIQPLLNASDDASVNESRASYYLLGSKGNSLRDPLEGVLLDPATQLLDRTKNATRLASLMGTSQWFDWKQDLESEMGNPLTPDRIWEGKLRTLAKSASPESIPPVLLEIAATNRRTGNWNRWYAALEMLLELDTKSPASEACFWELMRYTGSHEVQMVISQQSQKLNERLANENASTVSGLQQASPFTKDSRESAAVQAVSFTRPVHRIPIAAQRELSEFTQLLSQWPDTFQARRSEPRWGWLIASRYRALQERSDVATNVDLNRKDSVFWPPQSANLSSWKHVHEAERWVADSKTLNQENGLLRAATRPDFAKRIPILTERPLLDGRDDEALWKNAPLVELRDPWSLNQQFQSSLRLARDSEFLYIFSSAALTAASNAHPAVTKAKATSTNKSNIPSGESRRDSVSTDSDHLRLRLDLDRDYASWFELAWSSTGETYDACNDMAIWNPTWYVATSKDENQWYAEIAIPLTELIGQPESGRTDWTQHVWALNAVRSVPSQGTQSIAPSLSDRITSDQWILIDPRGSK